ncbi:MAG: ABC transporter permease [Actinomycetota bacterium]|nr:ABC transporter permease [Actinomycetota bacterium]
MPRPTRQRVDAVKLAEAYGLKPVGRRPSLPVYLRETWRRRHFAWSLAWYRAFSRSGKDRLGALWFILNPLLLAVVYYVMFGVVLQTRQGIPNFIGYLTIGVFLFHFTSRSLSTGSKSMVGSQGLIRSLRFPRIILPLSKVLEQLISLIPALGVMLVVVIVAPPDESITLAWLLIIPAVLIQTVFNLGLALIVARIGAQSHDALNLVPFFGRYLFYTSAVFYEYDKFIDNPTALALLRANPVYAFLTITREAVLNGRAAPLGTWVQVSVWALALLVIGVFVFWRYEESYGRD